MGHAVRVFLLASGLAFGGCATPTPTFGPEALLKGDVRVTR